MQSATDLIDIFTGKSNGSQGIPTTEGPGDGRKGDQITDYLSRITGAYNAITGQGNIGGPAPSAKAGEAVKQTNWLLIGGVALALGAIAWLLFKRK